MAAAVDEFDPSQRVRIMQVVERAETLQSHHFDRLVQIAELMDKDKIERLPVMAKSNAWWEGFWTRFKWLGSTIGIGFAMLYTFWDGIRPVLQSLLEKVQGP